MSINKNTKIEISIGCAEWMQKEIEGNRKQLELLSARTEVMDNFFSLVNGLKSPSGLDHSPDQLWQAKKEIADAIHKISEPSPEPESE